MINYNLAGNALIHCLKVSRAKLILVDDNPAFRARIEESQATVEGELGLKICIMDSPTRNGIWSLKPERPENAYRDGVKGDWPMAMFYTRYSRYLTIRFPKLISNSGTTGLPKGVPFNVDRGFDVGVVVSYQSGFLMILW